MKQTKLLILNNNDFFNIKKILDIGGREYSYSEINNGEWCEYKIITSDKVFITKYKKKNKPNHKKMPTTDVFMNFYKFMEQKYAEIKTIRVKYTGTYKEDESTRHNNKTYLTFLSTDGNDLYEIRKTEIWKNVDAKFSRDEVLEIDICFTKPSWEALRITFNNITWIRAAKYIYRCEDYLKVK